jgi:S-adenosylmethionine hydrolase
MARLAPKHAPESTMAIITLTTDFGGQSPYAAVLKGVIYTLHPEARVVDLCHDLPPQDLPHAAFYVREALSRFPRDAIHVVVVDPGVGTARRLLCARLCCGFVLAPDNGVWTWLPDAEHASVRHLINAAWWAPQVSHTFHGRDILAPAAARIAQGDDISQVGPNISDWVRLPFPVPRTSEGRWEGEVIYIDGFGNALTNLCWSEVSAAPELVVEVAGHRIAKRVRTYGEASAGELIVLGSSSGWLEIARVEGNAARALGLRRGTPVRVSSSPSGKGS